MNVKQEGGEEGGLLKHQQNLPRINKGFKKLTHKFKDINYEAEPQQSQELHKYIHWLTLFCSFLLFFVCVLQQEVQSKIEHMHEDFCISTRVHVPVFAGQLGIHFMQVSSSCFPEVFQLHVAPLLAEFVQWVR